MLHYFLVLHNESVALIVLGFEEVLKRQIRKDGFKTRLLLPSEEVRGRNPQSFRARSG